MRQPDLETSRLILRPFQLDDADRVHQLVNDPLISDVTAHIPHPYPPSLAHKWIATHAAGWENRTLAAFAITLKADQRVIGAASLMGMDGEKAGIGYWLGREFWNQGYCSEACRAICQFGFDALKLSVIGGSHLQRNPASGHILIKNGFQFIRSRLVNTGKREHDELVDFYQLRKG
ncbi:GNAT family N-acetyltransferase [Brenneria sp. g21c3]|uniref:GNAT family N-acetyltransferase n=1 Tax=Brenneria sp. g21c3 TaxID=3093893 RepID=UPI002EAC4F1C|nr:GNAT family N-acetyltransferase [Brenneria sp. g21c3]